MKTLNKFCLLGKNENQSRNHKSKESQGKAHRKDILSFNLILYNQYVRLLKIMIKPKSGT